MTPQAFKAQYLSQVEHLSRRLERWAALSDDAKDGAAESLAHLMVERDRLVWNLGPPFASEILDGDQVLLPLRPKIVELLGLEPDKLPNEAGAVSRWGARTFARGPRELPNW